MLKRYTSLNSLKLINRKTLQVCSLAVLFSLVAASAFAQKKKSAGNNIAQIFTYYMDIKNALVNDDGTTAKIKANELHYLLTTQPDKGLNWRQLRVLGDNLGPLIEDSRQIGLTVTEDEQRIYLSDFSKSLYALMKGLRMNTTKIYMQYCAKNNGYWLSESPVIKNPYYNYKEWSSLGKTTEVLAAGN